MQYTAHCAHCSALRSITRAEVATGKVPLCDFCGREMRVSKPTVALVAPDSAGEKR